jgi:aconitase A
VTHAPCRHVVHVKHLADRCYDRTAALDLSGIFPPITTPFNKDESIAYDKLASNIQQWEAVPFQGQFTNPVRILTRKLHSSCLMGSYTPR